MIQPELVAIVVRDMTAALRFYRLLGLDIPTGQDAEAYIEISLPNGLRMAWEKLEMVKEIYPNWTDQVSGHRMKVAYKCASPADVDALYELVIQNGYPSYKAPWDAEWGQRYAVVIDPDGNLVDLFAGL